MAAEQFNNIFHKYHGISRKSLKKFISIELLSLSINSTTTRGNHGNCDRHRRWGRYFIEHNGEQG